MLKWFAAGIAIVLVLMAIFLWLASKSTNGGVYAVQLHLMHHQEEGEEVEENEGGGTLVLGLGAEPSKIDPQAAAEPGMDVVLPYLFDTLVARDTANRLVPSLAEWLDVSGDGRMITVRLRPEVYFQDGNPVDAEAVRYTLTRFLRHGTASPIYDLVRRITSITVVDERTIRIEVDGPAAEVLNALAMPYAGILSPESEDLQPVGAGPLMLGDWERGQSLTLIRNNGYQWGPAVAANRRMTHVESVVVRYIPDPAARTAALEHGEVDVIMVDQPDQRSALGQNPAVRLDGERWAASTRIGGVRIGPSGQILIADVRIAAR